MLKKLEIIVDNLNYYYNSLQQDKKNESLQYMYQLYQQIYNFEFAAQVQKIQGGEQ